MATPKSFALQSLLRVEMQAVLGALAVWTWFFARSPADDYALLAASALVALVFVVIAVKRRRRDRVGASAVVWVLVYGFMVYAGRTARDDAFASMSDIARRRACADVACLRASGFDVARIGASDGYVVQRLGANVFVSFKAENGTCRLMSDAMLGGRGIAKWACSTGE